MIRMNKCMYLSLQNNLESCPICHKSVKSPLCLPCQHTYCQKFLDEILIVDKATRNKLIKCFICSWTSEFLDEEMNYTFQNSFIIQMDYYKEYTAIPKPLAVALLSLTIETLKTICRFNLEGIWANCGRDSTRRKNEEKYSYHLCNCVEYCSTKWKKKDASEHAIVCVVTYIIRNWLHINCNFILPHSEDGVFDVYAFLGWSSCCQLFTFKNPVGNELMFEIYSGKFSSHWCVPSEMTGTLSDEVTRYCVHDGIFVSNDWLMINIKI